MRRCDGGGADEPVFDGCEAVRRTDGIKVSPPNGEIERRRKIIHARGNPIRRRTLIRRLSVHAHKPWMAFFGERIWRAGAGGVGLPTPPIHLYLSLRSSKALGIADGRAVMDNFKRGARGHEQDAGGFQDA